MVRPMIVIVLLAALPGCSSQPMRELRGLFHPSKGEYAFLAGIQHYEEGRYGRAADYLQDAIEQGLTAGQLADAHKHLAFIHCAAGREQFCRNEFRNALTVNPSLQLAPAEAGHPVWGPVFREMRAEPPLLAGVRLYENGEYARSAKTLQGALEQGLTDKEQVTAHKLLAFIHCASKREKQCRDEFRKALTVDPMLDLAPAEAGHPIWGPVFRSVKEGR